MEAEDAERVIAIGKIGIGLEICKIQERMNIEKCYKCWAFLSCVRMNKTKTKIFLSGVPV